MDPNPEFTLEEDLCNPNHRDGIMLYVRYGTIRDNVQEFMGLVRIMGQIRLRGETDAEVLEISIQEWRRSISQVAQFPIVSFEFQSKWLVVTVFGIIVIWRHDALAMRAAMGAVANAWISITLKRILDQERPVASLGSGPGMPSSHAQSIFFASVYAILSLVTYLGLNGVTVTIGVLGLGFISYLSWLRISQRHHTISQVVVGAILGTICSILWFQSWYWFVQQAFLSFLWVRIIIVLGGVTCCVIFLLYVIKHWLMDGDED
ncbi:lipid phosphate phosphatase epsilon 1, chloroplastic-like [Papaver somniferum]|uniref:lipid phosphate phosphatase epsilon 1, chloroplastic-like n=1 Tax=Papaver somniferum TaxID=3469 RepID=UPI000E704214|nr:lipid phosphate phosphatase epsilon 1, chloroplastic-like [Papaver somniferum]